jgi:hypothetical protein
MELPVHYATLKTPYNGFIYLASEEMDKSLTYEFIHLKNPFIRYEDLHSFTITFDGGLLPMDYLFEDFKYEILKDMLIMRSDQFKFIKILLSRKVMTFLIKLRQNFQIDIRDENFSLDKFEESLRGRELHQTLRLSSRYHSVNREKEFLVQEGGIPIFGMSSTSTYPNNSVWRKNTIKGLYLFHFRSDFQEYYLRSYNVNECMDYVLDLIFKFNILDYFREPPLQLFVTVEELQRTNNPIDGLLWHRDGTLEVNPEFMVLDYRGDDCLSTMIGKQDVILPERMRDTDQYQKSIKNIWRTKCCFGNQLFLNNERRFHAIPEEIDGEQFQLGNRFFKKRLGTNRNMVRTFFYCTQQSIEKKVKEFKIDLLTDYIKPFNGLQPLQRVDSSLKVYHSEEAFQHENSAFGGSRRKKGYKKKRN